MWWWLEGGGDYHRYSLPALWLVSPIALTLVLVGLVVIGTCLLLASIQWLRVQWAAATGRPPLVTGWIPWIGAAIAMGSAKPALFLRRCQEKVIQQVLLHPTNRNKHNTTQPMDDGSVN